MAEYKHGTYGVFAPSIGDVARESGTVAVYVGAAPVNLIRDYEAYVNKPIKLTDIDDVYNKLGYSSNWSKFDLCEAFKVHFDNENGNIGPIVAINVLDPSKHQKSDETTESLAFVNGRATIKSDTIILNTLVLEGMVEGVDYALSYDFTKGQAVITSVGDEITGPVTATYSEIAVVVSYDDVIGGADAGVYTGLGCVSRIYEELNLIPNLIICPGKSSNATVYKAMLNAAKKINGHWDAMVYADLDVSISANTIADAISTKASDGYNSEFSKVFWPMAKGNDGNTYHISVLAAWATMRVDASHDGVPMESPSNKVLPMVASQCFCVEFPRSGFDQQQANRLNENGITTVVFWGGNWVLWGPHTAAFKHGEIEDNRSIFDNSVRMMMHISNSFQLEHALVIDSPMTRAMADTIKIREQEKADALAAIGALIGTPVVEFKESANSTADLVEGNFTWGFKGTPTPPFKSGTLQVAYTTAGFDSFFGEV